MSEATTKGEVKTELTPALPNKWDYDTFKEYLLSQARGEKFLLPLNDFPLEIELNEDWHRSFNVMRDASNRDNIERVGLVGFSLKRRAVFLPRDEVAMRQLGDFEWNGVNAVNPALEEWQKLTAPASGVEGFVGVLHSHPPDMIVLGRSFNILRGRLSAGDIFCVLKGDESLIGVADGRTNSIAFKTRESIKLIGSQKDFYDHWEGDLLSSFDLDEVLADKYKLALYRGNVNGNLKRSHPKK